MNLDQIAAEIKRLNSLVADLANAGPAHIPPDRGPEIYSLQKELHEIKQLLEKREADISIIAARVAEKVFKSHIQEYTSAAVFPVADQLISLETDTKQRINKSLQQVASEALQMKNIVSQNVASAESYIESHFRNFCLGE